MPHDLKGVELKPGDTVLMRFTVREVYLSNKFCNVSLQAQDVLETGEERPRVTCNARLTEKVEQ